MKLRNQSLLVAGISLVWLTSGCGKEDNSDASFSCTLPGGGACVDYIGSDYDNKNTVTLACESISGTFQESTCTADNRVGSCHLDQGTPTEKMRRYYSPSYSDSSANADCTDGTYTSG